VVWRRSDVPEHKAGELAARRRQVVAHLGQPFSISGEYTRVDPPKALGFTRNQGRRRDVGRSTFRAWKAKCGAAIDAETDRLQQLELENLRVRMAFARANSVLEQLPTLGT
jgi:hypothetical protein